MDLVGKRWRFIPLPGKTKSNLQTVSTSSFTKPIGQMKAAETTAEPKSCQNCGTGLTDRFCPHCGQDSKEFRRSVWGILVQFFETFTELDNTFLRSLVPLIFKPGFLTIQYLEGKRKRYLNPIQMYAFFSFLFFLMAFSLPSFEEEEEESIGKQIERNLYKEDSTSKKGKKMKADLGGTNFTIGFPGLKMKVQDTANGGPIELDHQVNSIREYDSLQNTLPEEKRDGFFTRIFYKRLLGINTRVQNKEAGVMEAMIDSFKSNIPNLVILLLPFFALILRLAYIRRKWYYVEHLIFGIHLHCFAFLILSLTLILDLFPFYTNEMEGLLLLSILIYTPMAMRRVYQQSWMKTFLKASFIAFSYCLVVIFGLLANLVFAALLMGS